MPLILAGDGDPHVEAVVTRLAARGVAPLRVNKALLTQLPLTVSEASCLVGTCDFGRVTSIWYRRLLPLILPPEMPAKWQRWCEQEFTHALFGALLQIQAHWVSDPASIKRASYKVHQLRIAAHVARFTVPEYVVTSDPLEASRFVRNVCRNHAVVKPLAMPVVSDEDSFSSIFTNFVPDLESDADLSDLRYAPCIFQRAVDKVAEIRVTVVGDKVFAAQIDTSAIADQADYRKVDPYTLPHSPIALPEYIHAGCLALRKFYGLRFAALDFLLDRDGNYYFLELNPNGQWLWIEEITGLPISDAIAEELCLSPQ